MQAVGLLIQQQESLFRTAIPWDFKPQPHGVPTVTNAHKSLDLVSFGDPTDPTVVRRFCHAALYPQRSYRGLNDGLRYC